MDYPQPLQSDLQERELPVSHSARGQNPIMGSSLNFNRALCGHLRSYEL